LQRAVNEANASPNGAVICLPAGTYRLRRPLTITNARVVLRGDGERRTTILIPISLGDYFKGSWTQSPGGKIVSQWSAGGAFITFEGKRQRSNNERTLLARIRSTKVVPRYSRTIPVRHWPNGLIALPGFPTRAPALRLWQESPKLLQPDARLP
jgi:hypothetical protein